MPATAIAVLEPESVAPAAVAPSRRRAVALALWSLRLAILAPFVLMGPEVVSLALGRPQGVAHVSASTADVLGTSSLLLFALMMVVTPLHTMTGWRWHLILRRDFGVAMFFTAGLDLTLAAITTEDTFPGGPLAHVAGHTFLVFGTLSVALLIPLVLTANRRSMRWLGRHWKSVQRLTYVLWVTILVHLAFLFGFSSFFVDALLISAPLLLLRLPPLRRRLRRARTLHAHRLARAGLGLACTACFLAGWIPLLQELIHKGGLAFLQTPPSQ
ncbi:MAG: hypothetical protein ACYDAC_11050 [Candidatus Dormibacteria bacterium]